MSDKLQRDFEEFVDDGPEPNEDGQRKSEKYGDAKPGKYAVETHLDVLEQATVTEHMKGQQQYFPRWR